MTEEQTESSLLKSRIEHVYNLSKQLFNDHITCSAQILYLYAFCLEAYTLSLILNGIFNKWKNCLPLDLQYNDVDFAEWSDKFNNNDEIPEWDYFHIDSFSFLDISVSNEDKVLSNFAKNILYIDNQEKEHNQISDYIKFGNNDYREHFYESYDKLTKELQKIKELLELPNESLLLLSFDKLNDSYCSEVPFNLGFVKDDDYVNVFDEFNYQKDIEEFKKWKIKIPKKDLDEKINEKLKLLRESIFLSGFLKPMNDDNPLSPQEVVDIYEGANWEGIMNPDALVEMYQNEYSFSLLLDDSGNIDADSLARYILFNRTKLSFEQLCLVLKYTNLKKYIDDEIQKKKSYEKIDSDGNNSNTISPTKPANLAEYPNLSSLLPDNIKESQHLFDLYVNSILNISKIVDRGKGDKKRWCHVYRVMKDDHLIVSMHANNKRKFAAAIFEICSKDKDNQWKTEKQIYDQVLFKIEEQMRAYNKWEESLDQTYCINIASYFEDLHKELIKRPETKG